MNFSLNYVWIEATKLPMPDGTEMVVCTVPEQLLSNVSAIAEAYSELTVSLWVDIYGIGNHPEEILTELNNQVRPSNVTIRALEEIPTYQTNDLFQKTSYDLKYSSDALWQQVDLARLYVLNHCLVTDGVDGAIYADMDLDLISGSYIRPTSSSLANSLNFNVTSPFWKAVQKLEKHGLIVGCEDSKMTAENQFIGLTMRGYEFFRDTLVPMTTKTINDGWNGWYGHADAFRPMYLKPHGINFSNIKISIPSIDPHKKIKKRYVDARTTPVGTGTITILPAQFLPLQP